MGLVLTPWLLMYMHLEWYVLDISAVKWLLNNHVLKLRQYWYLLSHALIRYKLISRT